MAIGTLKMLTILALLALHTGLRRGEIDALRWAVFI
jgi:hypothetical protein